MAGAPSLEPFLPQARGEGEAGLWEDRSWPIASLSEPQFPPPSMESL